MIELFQNLYTDSKTNFLSLLSNHLQKQEKTFVITANPEIFMQATTLKDVHEMMLRDDIYVIADGEGVVKGAKMLNYDIWGKIAGVEVAKALLKEANQQHKSLYVYGCKQEVLDAFSLILKKQYSNIKIASLRNGYDYKEDFISNEIQQLQPDIILVALGVPTQERFIYRHYDAFDKGIFVGVGGSIDVLSNTKKRAPKLFISLKLEWLYRIIKEPKRWKRFYNSHIKYIQVLRKEAKNK